MKRSISVLLRRIWRCHQRVTAARNPFDDEYVSWTAYSWRSSSRDVLGCAVYRESQDGTLTHIGDGYPSMTESTFNNRPVLGTASTVQNFGT